MALKAIPKTKVGRKRPELSLSKVRSALTNGSSILADVDHRSAWMRRLRDLIQLHMSDVDDGNISEAARSLIKRASMLELQLEMMDSKFAANNGEATLPQLQAYQSACNTLRRTLEAVSGGLERRARNVTPSLSDYLRNKQRLEAAE